jgi:hypothetical protein
VRLLNSVVIIAAIVAAAILIALPLCLGWVNGHDQFKFGEYGSWLQGTLTPIAILVAMLAVLLQSRGQAEANAIQAKANKQLLMGIMLDNLQRLEGHLNYMAAIVCLGTCPASDEVRQKAICIIFKNFGKSRQTPNLARICINYRKS